MTRQKHDQYSKQFVAELLESKGNAQIQYEISPGESHHADIYFIPAPDADFQTLGLLGKIAARPCIIEPFRNQPTKIEIQTCLQKLFTLRSELLSKAEREQKALTEEERKKRNPLKEEELPHLWILTTSASDNLLHFLGAKPKHNWCEGVYICGANVNRTAIVAINRLPTTPETLLLRLLGKGATQKQAIEEIRAFPEDHALRNHVEGLLFRWRICITAHKNLTQDDKEVLMNLSKIYQDWRDKTLQEGRKEGQKEGQKEGRLEERSVFVKNLLLFRFGTIDDALSQIIKPLLQLPPQDSSRLLLQSSREELLAKLS